MGFWLEGTRKALRFPKLLFAFCSLFFSLVLQSKGVKFNCANFLRKKMKLFFEGIKKPPISQGFNQKLNYENNAKNVACATKIRIYFPSSTVICETVVIIVPAVIK